MLKKVIALVIVVKIVILIIITGSFHIFPFVANNYYSNFHYPQKERINETTPFKTWDGQGYLYLSRFGYKPGSDLNRFYPLFPFIIYIGTLLFHNSLVSGLFMSNILSLIAIIYFYLFVRDYFGSEKIAYTTVLFLLSFPTSFYFSLVYSESVCFFLVVLFFYYLYKNQLWYASTFALLLPLSRPVGIGIIFPFLYTLWQSSHVPKKRIFFALSPLLGICFYFIYMSQTTRSPVSSFVAAKHMAANWQVTNIFHIPIFLFNLFSPTAPLHGITNSLVDRVFFILFIFSLYFIYKKLDKTLWIYAVVIGCVPLFGSFMSYTRYLLLVFPLFMVLALFVESKQYHRYKAVFLLLLSVMQVTFLISHTLNYWIA